MKKANTIGADKYFHAKGNYEAAKRGTGGKHAAAIIRYTSVQSLLPCEECAHDKIRSVESVFHKPSPLTSPVAS